MYSFAFGDGGAANAFFGGFEKAFLVGVSAERAMQAIRAAADTGQIGDGKILVLPMEAAIRIRTGESGNNAL